MVQGLTEFLPVSSSGHLVLGQALLDTARSGIVFEVAVHAATLVAVLVYYRTRLFALGRDTLQRRPEAWRYVGKLALATVPAAVAGVAGGDFFEAQFERPAVAAVCLLATGGLVWTTRYSLPRATTPEPGWSVAWWIGCAQALAILPGISRSGATVATALALGVAPVPAATFSFLMSIPAILGAAVLQLAELEALASSQRIPIVLGALAAAASGLAALAIFVRVLRAGRFHRFAYYAWAVGAGALVWIATVG